MANKTLKIVSEEFLYQKSDLLENILSQIELDNSNISEETSRRDYEYKLKVIQYILDAKFQTQNNNEELLKKSVDLDVEQNPSLFSFTYFLSSQQNFDIHGVIYANS